MHRQYPPQTINSKNQIAGITPTTEFWDVIPGTFNEISSEDLADNDLTTPGDASAAGGTLTYDLGSIKRIEISMMQQGGGATGASMWLSNNNIGFNFKGSMAAGQRLRIIERARYISFHAAVNAILTQIRIKIYQI